MLVEDELAQRSSSLDLNLLAGLRFERFMTCKKRTPGSAGALPLTPFSFSFALKDRKNKKVCFALINFLRACQVGE